MMLDRFAARHSSPEAGAVRAFESAAFAVLAHRPGAAEGLDSCLALDPDFTAAHALKGLGAVLLARAELQPAIAASLADARSAAARRGASTMTEAALFNALAAASGGRLHEAAQGLSAALARQPDDLLLMKLSVALNFMGGDLAGMRQASETAMQAFDADRAGHGFILGCQAFALEESGDRRAAEMFGRRAAEIEPADAWGLHAVAHVFEMEGRTGAGISWLEQTRANWQRCNNFSFHIAWHLALFHLAEGDHARVLELYDNSVRPAPTDDFRDIANAVSLLWRLEQDGVAVERRWDELACIAERRRNDASLMFASLHYLMALKAAGRPAAAAQLLETIRAAASLPGDQAAVAAAVALPLAVAIQGRPRNTSGAARCLTGLSTLGGSGAQRDIFLRIAAVSAADNGENAAAERVLRLRQSLRAEDRFSRRVRRQLRLSEAKPSLPPIAAFAG